MREKLMNNLCAVLKAHSVLTYLHANKAGAKKRGTGEAVHIIIKKKKEKDYVSKKFKTSNFSPPPSTFTSSTLSFPSPKHIQMCRFVLGIKFAALISAN